VREIRQAVTSFNQRSDNRFSGTRIEINQVVKDPADLT
jgi:hypothetical protein